MAWAAVAAAVIGAGASYYSSSQANKAAKKASSGTGQVDLTTANSPWGPSENYRLAGMGRAYDLLGRPGIPQNNSAGYEIIRSPDGTPHSVWHDQAAIGSTGYQGGTPGAGTAGTAETGDPRAAWRAQRRRNGGAGNAGGGVTGGPTPAPGNMSTASNQNFNGVSPETARILEGITGRATAGHPLYNDSTAFTQDILNGVDRNGYRSQTFDALANNSDPDLQRFKDLLFSGSMPGSGASGGSGMSGFYGYGGSGGGGGQAGGEGPVGAAAYIREILEGKYLNEGNPYRQKLVDQTSGDISRNFQREVIPGINDQFIGAGMFGSRPYSDALGKSTEGYTRELANNATAINEQDYNARMEDLMGALGMGTQMDISAADRAAQSASSANATAAGLAGQRAGIDSQERLARLGALQDAIGMGIGQRNSNLSGMSGLSGQFGQEQLAALGLVPDLTGMDIRDYSAAGSLSLGADQNRLTRMRDSSNASIARGGLNLQRQQFEAMLPWQQLGAYSDVINAMSGAYGSQNQAGQNGGYQAPAYISPWGQAISGGIAGYQLGSQYQNRSSNNSGVQLVPGSYSVS